MIIRSKTMIGDVEIDAVLHVRDLGEPAETEDEFRQRVSAARYPWPRHGTIACPCIFCGDPDRLARERSELLGLMVGRIVGLLGAHLQDQVRDTLVRTERRR